MLRIGAVSYLNSRPLIYGLADRLRGIGRLVTDLPSRLASQLAAGQLDVALIPSAEYLRGQSRGYQLVSDAVVACRGPVWSVRLMSRCPVAQIRSLALDDGSRTSAALAQILLAKHYGIRPQTSVLPIDCAADQVDTDAVLLIGDRAMHPPAGRYQEIIDLGQWWSETTQLPFVFAAWVGRPGLDELTIDRDRIDRQRLETMLSEVRDEGLRNYREIAAAEAGPHGLTVADLQKYFTSNLHYTFGPSERQALAAFEQSLLMLDQYPLENHD